MQSLEPPRRTGTMPVEEALIARRSVRSFTGTALSDQDLSQLLFAAQGITDSKRNLRSAPSAGASYPLELYVVGPRGMYHYLPAEHALRKISAKDHRDRLADAANGQEFIRNAGANFVFTAVTARTSERYGQRATKYVHMEAGHAAQNIHLQAVALGLGSVPVGAFHDKRVLDLLGIKEKEETPLYIIPVGKPSR